ncbi:MAG TPA: acetyl-CoA acetyltransferase [Gordonia sp. (in: high G+C Gram-positive bacteria)]|uniref:acetyl-CoA acetyltransferase n=1 Tax=unclassified Gordonia (in: high G+C Gram-positive bacteria) TaxID=2657482 RepID=UPI000FA601B5|nr:MULTISPECIES: acetyl-CoA acetyltransferase [unclassified Gordonia (in: high G+C Gram-positive bacteria)]RUP40301.1 MAG: thiolase domain-containing protein [Gordonia sp. (in: high G+C Gram-positive bacteria)]HNP57259.1 acetyl-CoA acetyltransferase [Gordonia sp. (in: high G+C Gram-positive bacteria)]HRC49323.1 acetyl-CoA acetyltransferase [Gordonia sp. (in: high G+C Gram-positive bacteria)]
MPEHVHILGGYQTDFARNVTKEGGDLSTLTDEVVTGTLAEAGVTADDIEVIHVGNAFGQVYTGQGHLGAMPATMHPELWGVPASRHEGACASGSLAILAAMSDLESGRYDCALVIGVELEKNVPGDVGAKNMAGAGWLGHDGEGATFLWPHTFSRVAEEYDDRFGLDPKHLWAIAELNIRNARTNPRAQTRGWSHDDASFTDDPGANPVVEGRMHKADCGPLTDGGAGVVLVSDRWLAAHPEHATARSSIRGWGHRTAGLALEEKLAKSAGDGLVFPHVSETIGDAFNRAGIASVDDLDLIETHDCFTSTEYVAIDHFGLTEPGQSWKAVESGELEIGGRVAMNPSGGLIGGGHPVGATGVRMLLDCHRQVTKAADGYQVPDAATAATLNIGGSMTTVVSFVVGV